MTRNTLERWIETLEARRFCEGATFERAAAAARRRHANHNDPMKFPAVVLRLSANAGTILGRTATLMRQRCQRRARR